MKEWEISHSKWWKVRCMALDVLDYSSGDMDKKTFLGYMRGDIEELKQVLDEEERS